MMPKLHAAVSSDNSPVLNDKVERADEELSGNGYDKGNGNRNGIGLLIAVLKMVQKPFPILDTLAFPVIGGDVAFSSSFLGGSAPHLRVLHLDVFRYKGFKLPPILSSATHLVDLRLTGVESADCIPPEVLVTALSTLVQLKSLCLQFLCHAASSHSSNPRNMSPPLSGYTYCSNLLSVYFDVPCNYLEDLLSRISAPSLESILDVSEFSRFLSRIKSQRLPDVAEVTCHDLGINLVHTQSPLLPGGQPKTRRSEWLRLEFPHTLYHGLSPLNQICQQISPILSGVRTLSIPILKNTGYGEYSHRLWLDLLRVFDGVEEVHLTGSHFGLSKVIFALELVMASDVLPSLRKLSLDKMDHWHEAAEYRYQPQDLITSLIDEGNLARFPPITLQWLDQ
ncbi:hypothetical protein V8E53_007880 [Lactarius tabidus]